MSNAVNTLVKQKALQALLATGNVRAVLLNTTGDGTLYTYSSAHDFLNDIPSGARVADSGPLTNMTFTNGVFDADDLTFYFVSGATVEALWVYLDTGVEGTSLLLSYHDSLTLTPSGISVVVQWSSSGIFSV